MLCQYPTSGKFTSTDQICWPLCIAQSKLPQAANFVEGLYEESLMQTCMAKAKASVPTKGVNKGKIDQTTALEIWNCQIPHIQAFVADLKAGDATDADRKNAFDAIGKCFASPPSPSTSPPAN